MHIKNGSKHFITHSSWTISISICFKLCHEKYLLCRTLVLVLYNDEKVGISTGMSGDLM
jgi:hypothetical protein